MDVHEFDKCVVQSKSGGNAATGFVVEYESAYLKMQANNNFLLRPSQEVYLLIYNQVKGECRYEATVRDIRDNVIFFENVKLVGSMQKRNNTRVSKELHYKITERIQDDKTIALEKPVEITILNISAQGMYINSDENFYIGFRFPLTFRELKRPIRLVAEIIRREVYTRSFNYGCFFVGISNKDMDEIFRYVLKEQIEQRRKNLLI